MKILYIGFSKTGTKTMRAVFQELGYRVYDFQEHSFFHGKEWNKILKRGATVDDFRAMYQDVDVVLDIPVYFYWEEILQAFPSVKVN